MPTDTQSQLFYAKTIVVNVKDSDYDVFIGRPTKWGNPFEIGRDGTRAECIAKYREWILTKPKLLSLAKTLRGKRLGCYCAPEPCHGDILAQLADGELAWSEHQTGN